MNVRYSSWRVPRHHHLAILIGLLAFLLVYFAGYANGFAAAGLGLGVAALIFIALCQQSART